MPFYRRELRYKSYLKNGSFKKKVVTNKLVFSFNVLLTFYIKSSVQDLFIITINKWYTFIVEPINSFFSKLTGLLFIYFLCTITPVLS